jgi:hypothetical protein
MVVGRTVLTIFFGAISLLVSGAASLAHRALSVRVAHRAVQPRPKTDYLLTEGAVDVKIGLTPGRRIESPAAMGLVFATTAGLVAWIVLWSIGYSGLDSGLLALIVILLGASGRIVLRYLPGGSGRSSGN